MKQLIHGISLFLVLLTFGFGATRSDINAIEAAERIRFLSQKIAKDYLYLYARPKRHDIFGEISDMMVDLNKALSVLSSSTKDKDTRDLLKYLQYNKESIEKLLQDTITKASALQMLDYSEVLLEGAKLITEKHRYSFNAEEAMLMQIKKTEFLIERLGKFYMLSSLGVLSPTNQSKMKESARLFEESLHIIQKYQYPAALQKEKKQLSLFWKFGQYSLAHAYDIFVPNLLNTTGNHFEKLLAKYARYHSKSQ